MGLDIELFVHPERISSQLICPICTQVLDSPVQTATEHLFCEEELLEWMSRSSLCPITKTELDPASIRKPGRIVLNMLAELEMYCKNRGNGCTWTGPHEHLDKHMETCTHRSKEEEVEELQQQISFRDERINELEQQVQELTSNNAELAHENVCQREKIEEYQRRIRVFNALLPQNSSKMASERSGEYQIHSLAESLSMLLMDDDESLNDSFINNNEDSFVEDSKIDISPERPSTAGKKDISDAERLRRLRALSSLNAKESKFAHK